MYSKGIIKETYVQAVLDREKIYPTGLPTNSVKVAIPHTDSSHVNKSAVSIAVLYKPVEFMMMGGTGERLQVEIVFLLAIEDPSLQLEALKELMQMFQNDELLEKIKNSNSKEDILFALDKLTV
jgi:PTS system galactitol-specific IIA component